MKCVFYKVCSEHGTVHIMPGLYLCMERDWCHVRARGGAGKDKVTDMSLRYLLPDLCLASGHNRALLLLATTSSQTRLRTQFNHRLRDVQFESFRQDHLYVGAQQNP